MKFVQQHFMKAIISLFISTIIISSCARKAIPSIPDCIRKKIEAIKAEPKWNPPAEINEYEYKGKRVFLITAPCCDRYTELVDENCNYLCAPSGGYTGKGDEKCKDFNQEAKHIRLVWKDDR